MNKQLFQNIDNAPLIIFRIILGFLIACEGFGAIATGWVTKALVEPQFTFNFIGFDWLQPLPGNGMYFYFVAIGILGISIMLGFRYRFSIIAFTLLWGGVYFMQKSSYNNHYYFLLIVCFVMIFLPANKDKSLDCKYKYTMQEKSMPKWINLIFIGLVGILYTYASIAKLYPDWLDGTFTKNLLTGATNNVALRSFFGQKWFYLFIAYAGILFDLLIVPLLLFKRTRTWALIASLIFHLFNSIALQIGIFPYFALSFALFFYPSGKIRQFFFKEKTEVNINTLNFSYKKTVYYIFIPLLLIQFLLPLRHHFIKGNVLWTEEGHRLSWRMMLRNRNGFIKIKVVRPKSLDTLQYNYRKNLTSKQIRQLSTKPDFIWQYCQKIKDEFKDESIEIYIDCKNSINGKPYKALINPKINMAQADWNYFFHNEWILLYN